MNRYDLPKSEIAKAVFKKSEDILFGGNYATLRLRSSEEPNNAVVRMASSLRLPTTAHAERYAANKSVRDRVVRLQRDPNSSRHHTEKEERT